MSYNAFRSKLSGPLFTGQDSNFSIVDNSFLSGGRQPLALLSMEVYLHAIEEEPQILFLEGFVSSEGKLTMTVNTTSLSYIFVFLSTPLEGRHRSRAKLSGEASSLTFGLLPRGQCVKTAGADYGARLN